MKTILAILVGAFSVNAMASTAGPGNLSTVHFFSNGKIIAYTNGTKSGVVPACATNQPSRFAIDGSLSGGKLQAAGLVTAYASGKKVVIVGKGNCDVIADTESIDHFYTSDQ